MRFLLDIKYVQYARRSQMCNYISQAIIKSSPTPLTDLRVSVPFTSGKELAAFVSQFKRQPLRSLNLVGTLINLDCLDTIIDTFPSITDLSFTIEVNIRSNDFLVGSFIPSTIGKLTSLCFCSHRRSSSRKSSISHRSAGCTVISGEGQWISVHQATVRILSSN